MQLRMQKMKDDFPKDQSFLNQRSEARKELTMTSRTSTETKRLKRLFDRYNRLYWHGKMPICRVVAATLAEETSGHYVPSKRLIEIDLAKQKNPAQLRGTMLHEMAHAAADQKGSYGHDVKFFSELERLLQRNAPITIDTPEAGRVRTMRDVVPARFPLLKRKMDWAEARRTRSIERYIRDHKLAVTTITDEDIIWEFKEAATELPWKHALLHVGKVNGLVDETGCPVNAWAQRLVARGRKAHSRARRAWNCLSKGETA
jgi:hypothetical protein